MKMVLCERGESENGNLFPEKLNNKTLIKLNGCRHFRKDGTVTIKW